MFCIRMKVSEVAACVPRKTGTTTASPMKVPIGSTSSRMMVAVSDAFTSRCARGVKRSISEKSWKRRRRSTRSPSTPFDRLIQNLKAPLISTRARNSPDRPSSSSVRPSWNPSNRRVSPPPSQCGQRIAVSRNGAVGLPCAKALPVIASLTMRLGRSSDAK